MGCRGLTRLLRRLRRKFKSNINQQLALATERSTANALHDVQDLNARDHGPDKVRDGLQSKDFLTKDFWKHVYHDSFPSVSERSEALQNSRNLLKKTPISITKIGHGQWYEYSWPGLMTAIRDAAKALPAK